MSDLFDDLEDFGAFDDVVSGNVRDPYPELAKQRHETPIQRIDMSAMPGEEGKPVFIVYRHEDIQTMLRDNETYSSNDVIQISPWALSIIAMIILRAPWYRPS